MTVKERIRKVWELVTRSGQPFRCASCGQPITDPDQAVATEVTMNLGDGTVGPVYVAACCELCLRRVRRRGIGTAKLSKVIEE